MMQIYDNDVGHREYRRRHRRRKKKVECGANALKSKMPKRGNSFCVYRQKQETSRTSILQTAVNKRLEREM